MQTPTTPQPAPPLRRATPCITCGYNLAGLPDTSHCPECAHSIADSLSRQGKRQPLDLEPILHLLGVTLTLLACLGGLIGTALGPLHALHAALGGGAFKIEPIYFAVPITLLLGATLATRSLPVPIACRPNRLRLAGRFMAIAAGVLLAVTWWLWISQINPALLPDWIMVSFITGLSPTLVLVATICCLQWSRLRRQRRRRA